MDETDTNSDESRHEPRLDTVAQKPGNMGNGTPVSDPHVDAHLDCGAPTPGAQPPQETESPSLREPHRVAAGMPALTQSIKFTMRETGFTRGIGTW